MKRAIARVWRGSHTKRLKVSHVTYDESTDEFEKDQEYRLAGYPIPHPVRMLHNLVWVADGKDDFIHDLDECVLAAPNLAYACPIRFKAEGVDEGALVRWSHMLPVCPKCSSIRRLEGEGETHLWTALGKSKPELRLAIFDAAWHEAHEALRPWSSPCHKGHCNRWVISQWHEYLHDSYLPDADDVFATGAPFKRDINRRAELRGEVLAMLRREQALFNATLGPMRRGEAVHLWTAAKLITDKLNENRIRKHNENHDNQPVR